MTEQTYRLYTEITDEEIKTCAAREQRQAERAKVGE